MSQLQGSFGIYWYKLKKKNISTVVGGSELQIRSGNRDN